MDTVKPYFRGHSHQAMFFVALGACALLIASSDGQREMIASAVYSLTTLTLFGISALYHRINWQAKTRAFMRRLDHSAIYISMVGTGTPICMLAMDESSGPRLLSVLIIVSILGILKSVFLPNLPHYLRAGLYFIAGSIAVFYTPELWGALGNTKFTLLLAGGISYSIGAITYGLKRPKLVPHIFGYHELFHLFVNIGAFLHFVVIYLVIKGH